jgi:hypothetical protein
MNDRSCILLFGIFCLIYIFYELDFCYKNGKYQPEEESLCLLNFIILIQIL